MTGSIFGSSPVDRWMEKQEAKHNKGEDDDMEKKVHCLECGWKGDESDAVEEEGVLAEPGSVIPSDQGISESPLQHVCILICPQCHCLVREDEK